MKVSSLLKGGIYEVSFGYNPQMEGYTTLMSDIPMLSAIRKRAFGKGDRKFMTLLHSFNGKERRTGKEIYDIYRDFCKKKGCLISRQFKFMIEKQMKEDRK
jgi:hypothetical protein